MAITSASWRDRGDDSNPVQKMWDASHWLLRFAPIPLALGSFLACAPQAAAVDTTPYVPFAAEVICKNVSNFACTGSLLLPNNRNTVLEYVSVTCTNLTPGSRLFSLAI